MTRTTSQTFAKGLGIFSLALGAVELLAAKSICRALGMEGRETLVQAYGAREVATGIAILASRDPTPWILGRVAGDALDIATVATALRDDNPKGNNVIATLGVLAGATGLDVLCATGLLASDPVLATARRTHVHQTDPVALPRPVPDPVDDPSGLRGSATLSTERFLT